MNWSKEFVDLDKSIHDRTSFDCGEAELNTFIQTRAAKHMEVGVSTTRLIPNIEPLANGKYPICAFYTVTLSQIEKRTLPRIKAKQLPNYPVPTFLLAQLAVHSDCMGQGLGKITLVNALEYLLGINSLIRTYAVTVDCLNEGVENFYSQYGFELLHRDNGRARMFLPMECVAALFQS